MLRNYWIKLPLLHNPRPNIHWSRSPPGASLFIYPNLHQPASFSAHLHPLDNVQINTIWKHWSQMSTKPGQDLKKKKIIFVIQMFYTYLKGVISVLLAKRKKKHLRKYNNNRNENKARMHLITGFSEITQQSNLKRTTSPSRNYYSSPDTCILIWKALYLCFNKRKKNWASKKKIGRDLRQGCSVSSDIFKVYNEAIWIVLPAFIICGHNQNITRCVDGIMLVTKIQKKKKQTHK